MGFADLARVGRVLGERGLDGLVVVSPENFSYFAGVPAGPIAAMWRRAGPVAAVVSAAGQTAFVVPDAQAGAVAQANPGAIVLDHTVWIERVEVDPAAGDDVTALVARATANRPPGRPETYDWAVVCAQLRAAMAQLGLAGGRIGLELEFAPAADVDRLRAALAPATLVDSSAVLRELRLIKTPREIDLIRQAVELTEIGIMASLTGLDRSTLALDIAGRYAEAVSAEGRRRRLGGLEGARTTVQLGPHLWGTGDPDRAARPGDVIQFDSTLRLHGYNSDIGRTFTVGPADTRQRQIQQALLAGFAAGLEQLRPGRRFRDVHAVTQQAVRAHGFPSYTRGHFGHSIGSELGTEEWPFFSAVEERSLAPGMVVAFEVPYYLQGIGGFQNEDNLIVTETGHESLNRLPLELMAVRLAD